MEFRVYEGAYHLRIGVLRARNSMTAQTAFGVLHLLDHLQHLFIYLRKDMDFHEGAQGDGCSMLNPSILRLLSDGVNAYRPNTSQQSYQTPSTSSLPCSST